MLPPQIARLPIAGVLPRIREILATRDELVLQAAPGAGKTTGVPLCLMDEPWLRGQRILLLEPRRIAARAAAEWMAELLGEAPGERIGYRIRLESRVSAKTRVEVVTEGILTRRIQQDPALEGVGLIIFDEFHERSLHSDLGLALALQSRSLFRDGLPQDGLPQDGLPLKLLVMSATLDGEAVARLLADAPVITSKGRQFPVSTRYGRARQVHESVLPQLRSAVTSALREQEGSVLVFLPGQREIRSAQRELRPLLPPDTYIAPLYGGLSLAQQRQAMAPPAPGQRKVVLATNVAETSLTIEGIAVVVDSGLVRQARFDPGTGVTQLVTRRVCRDAADQRRGRAGRLGPGLCYRLWSEEQQARLEERTAPEIVQADLAGLALQLLAWGVTEPAELAWLDPPPTANWDQALNLLENLGALSQEGGGLRLTPHGVRLAELPLHPRLAHMLRIGRDLGATRTAALLAALLEERTPASDRGADILELLDLLQGDAACPEALRGWLHRCRQQARRLERLVGCSAEAAASATPIAADDLPGVLLARAFPDRIGRRRPGANPSSYQLANGRMAELGEGDPLAGSEWISAAEVGGSGGRPVDRIFSATALNPAHFGDLLAPLVITAERAEWDGNADRFVVERRQQVGRLLLRVEAGDPADAGSRVAAVLDQIRKRGLALLPWTAELECWRRRVQLLRRLYPERQEPAWPDLSETALLEQLEQWLAPHLEDVWSIADLRRLELRPLLQAMLPWPLPAELDRLAPERITVPSGSRVAIDYSQEPPVLAVKLQEMFGLDRTPTIAGGRQTLLLHLLSPARRPIQVTSDLAGFWRGSYAQVRREMKGRYPKHPWPDDPLGAVPTALTKRRQDQRDSG